ncbi:hypothetical protein WIV_gp097 [Wiseana iridescent virus]|uniref:MSV199 domain-containing protein n=1 Tax=Wiseana iridescent virus TaxID=68347 RepID=G0T5C3_IRV9|nr:hypothetical protein WIV_gp097 [Wiseana iridescent virus]ADO00441.1 hypothetical protein [Wiseana iridescent virus]
MDLLVPQVCGRDVCNNIGLIDIFTFVKGFGVTFDTSSNWFQDLWYPLSKNRGAPRGAPEKVEGRPKTMPIVITENLLEWMGYKGRKEADKQRKFSKLLRSLEIEYEEIGYQHPFAIEYPCVQKESKQLRLSNNLEKKKWICMEPRSFKKAVLRLNTKSAEVVRDYYLNLEEAMFAYGDYTMNFLIEKTEKERKIKTNELSIAKQQLAIKDKEVEEEKQRANEAEENVKVELEARRKAELKAQRVNKFMRRSSVKEKKLEWIYIATTKKYAKERIFKPGSTERISKRINGYTTGHPKKDTYFYVWIKKCYNSKDLDNHIQKLLHLFKYKEKSNDSGRHELIHGIKLSDLIAIVDFVSDNYDANIDYVNNFIKTRLDQSLDEDDPEPIPLDIKKLTYHIGDQTETIDIEEEESESVKEAFEDVLYWLKEQYARNSEETVVVQRKDIMNRLSSTTNGNKKDLWNQIKELTGWISSKAEIDEGGFKYKIVY